MTKGNNLSSFHCFSSLKDETVKKGKNLRNNARNIYETKNLKDLSLLILTRNKTGNNHETEGQNNVSSKVIITKQAEPYLELQDWQYLFDERAGIYQFDAGLTKEEAEIKATQDIQSEYAQSNNLKLNDPQITNFINSLSVEL